MADTVIDRIFIALGLDASDVSKGLDGMEKKTKAVLAKITKDTIATALSFTALKKAITAFSDTSVSLDNLSKSTGVAVEKLQVFHGVFNDLGLEAETANNIFTQLSTSIEGALAGAIDDNAKALWRYGIALDNGKGKARDATEVFLDIADKIENVRQQYGDLAAIRVGKNLGLDRRTIESLKGGSAVLQELIEEQNEYSMVTAEDTQSALAYRRELDRLSRSWNGFILSIGRQFLPVFQKIAQMFGAFFKFLDRHSNVIIALLTALTIVMSAKMLPTIIKLTGAVAALGKAFLVAFNPLKSTAAAIVGTIALIILAIDDLYTYASSGKSSKLLTPLWEALGSPEEVMGIIKGIKSALSGFMDFMSGWTGTILGFLVKVTIAFGLIASPIALVFKVVKPFFSIFTLGIKTALPLLAKFKGAVLMIVPALKSMLAAILASSKAMLAMFVRMGAGIAAFVASKIPMLIAGLASASKAFHVIAGAIRAVGTALTANPIGAVVMALAMAAILVMENWEDVKSFFLNLWETIKGIGQKIKDFWDFLWGNEDKKEIEIETVHRDRYETSAPKTGELAQRYSVKRTEPQETEPMPEAKMPKRDRYREIRMADTYRPGQVNENRTLVEEFAGAGLQVQYAQARNERMVMEPPARMALPKSSIAPVQQSTVDNNITIDKIEIATQARDAEGISRSIGTALENNLAKTFVSPAMRGVNNK